MKLVAASSSNTVDETDGCHATENELYCVSSEGSANATEPERQNTDSGGDDDNQWSRFSCGDSCRAKRSLHMLFPFHKAEVLISRLGKCQRPYVSAPSSNNPTFIHHPTSNPQISNLQRNQNSESSFIKQNHSSPSHRSHTSSHCHSPAHIHNSSSPPSIPSTQKKHPRLNPSSQSSTPIQSSLFIWTDDLTPRPKGVKGYEVLV
jgi:hypothetical protein